MISCFWNIKGISRVGVIVAVMPCVTRTWNIRALCVMRNPAYFETGLHSTVCKFELFLIDLMLENKRKKKNYKILSWKSKLNLEEKCWLVKGALPEILEFMSKMVQTKNS